MIVSLYMKNQVTSNDGSLLSVQGEAYHFILIYVKNALD